MYRGFMYDEMISYDGRMTTPFIFSDLFDVYLFFYFVIIIFKLYSWGNDCKYADTQIIF